jgi:aldehyde dehydrogenase (NAD+)
MATVDVEQQQLLIGGEWRGASSGEAHEKANPFTGEPAGAAAAATREDARAAADAAAAAFPGWAATPPAQRAAHLERLHRCLTARAGEIARTVALELGTPLKVATRVQAGLPLTVLESYVRLAAEPVAEETVGNSLLVREPVGVVGAITPWNYPLHQIVAKVAPALAAYSSRPNSPRSWRTCCSTP